MKIIEVAAAIITKDNKYFLTQRGYGEFKDFWEFPGGKLELNETPEEACVREIKEELDADIKVIKNLGLVEYDYSSFYLKMHLILCTLENGHIDLIEAENSKRCNEEEISELDLLPADREALKFLI